MTRIGRLPRSITAYPELVIVIVAAAIGLAVRRPFAWADTHQGINVLLVVLVFATGVTIPPGVVRRLAASGWRVAAAVAVGLTVLPALAWAAAQLVAAGSLREGVLTVGLAPCEIASVATTTMAGGDPALAATVLAASTAGTIAVAGPILELEAGHAHVAPGHIAVNLLLVVALPLLAGVAVRSLRAPSRRAQRAAAGTTVAALAGLVALIASQVQLSTSYLGVIPALLVFLAVSAGVGFLLGRRASPASATAILLTVSMRDFAIAAGLANAAFGPPAAAPLALYGILVLVWGTAVAGQRRSAGRRPLPS